MTADRPHDPDETSTDQIKENTELADFAVGLEERAGDEHRDARQDRRETMQGTGPRIPTPVDFETISSITAWHPFMRFVFRVADMRYADLPPRERAHRFADAHRKTFWLCFLFDWLIILVGSAGVIMAVVFSVAKILGCPVPFCG